MNDQFWKLKERRDWDGLETEWDWIVPSKQYPLRDLCVACFCETKYKCTRMRVVWAIPYHHPSFLWHILYPDSYNRCVMRIAQSTLFFAKSKIEAHVLLRRNMSWCCDFWNCLGGSVCFEDKKPFTSALMSSCMTPSSTSFRQVSYGDVTLAKRMAL